ncbi:hypothetical protein MMC18_008056 [Xylographa bjoerkii]|nr:hypothetical protein [Xylographa bjoerkii]
MSSFSSTQQRNGSRLAKVMRSADDSSDADDSQNTTSCHAEVRSHGSFRTRAESSPVRTSFSSSLNQATPARSYFQRTYHATATPQNIPYTSSSSIREDTAELASRALSDVVSIRSRTPPTHHTPPAIDTTQANSDFFFEEPSESSIAIDRNDAEYPDVIEEVSEPVSPESRPSFHKKSPTTSILTDMIKNTPPTEEDEISSDRRHGDGRLGIRVQDTPDAELFQPHERTSLLHSNPIHASQKHQSYTSFCDLESLEREREGNLDKLQRKFASTRDQSIHIAHVLLNPKAWDRRKVWQVIILRPVGYVPAIALGLLLNILDALSYGLILFPLGSVVFEGRKFAKLLSGKTLLTSEVGPDGISMFYISCIVSQLIYSLGGSVFKGGVGSEMIEVVPFFHKMAFTILARVGEDNPKSVLATTVLSYSLSSLLTGAVFYLMGRLKLGSLIGFFPRHILIGCIGGVGWFLVATGLEVSARLEGNLAYNLGTVMKLIQLDTVFLWTIPLVLSVVLLVTKRWVQYPLTDAIYFLSIICIFYFFVAAIPQLNFEDLRSNGWIFEAPEAGVPFYHFYSLYDFGAVDWKALGSTIPAMFALTFFGVLHVPINIPALAMSTDEDNLDLDRELRAHGWSNALSGLCGSIQNYLVYTNTVLFMRSGGDSRIAGVLLAVATFGILVVGPVLIGFIPIMVVGALIFFLGFELMREALVNTWGRVNRLEYLTILIIVVTMGAYDFVVGIFIGIVLACMSFVIQTSQISAIRKVIDGQTASSTVRRHALQRHFLRQVGHQIYVMKLAGYLFFGTIVGVENRIRALLHEDAFASQPIRFIILDLSKVDGVDFSAAEAFPRINRILNIRDVQMLMSGMSLNGSIRKSLYNVGLLREDDGVEVFEDLNSALEFCENDLLKTLYHYGDPASSSESNTTILAIPEPTKAQFPEEIVFNSPRRDHLRQMAATTLREQQNSMPNKNAEQYEQPLQLMLFAFYNFSRKDISFWKRVTPFFTQREYGQGTTLYSRGDPADGFYILQTGILRAEYTLDQGTFSELIVSGTTCGELPFFSDTTRTSTTTADTDCVTWVLNKTKWERMQKEEPGVAQELLKISLKLTSERMDALTKYMLTSG